MAQLTIQLIEGLERGRIYANLETPVTIGREDDNTIQLNDERVSRFHAKIQDDGGRLILTDLESTNGTRVNGHPVQMRVLQIGDQMSIGRCLLIVGSRDEIEARVAEYRRLTDPGSSTGDAPTTRERIRGDDPATSHDQFSLGQTGDALGSANVKLFPGGVPGPPADLRPLQRAEISDFAAYVHDQVRSIIQSVCEDQERQEGEIPLMLMTWPGWQQLLGLEMDLAVYLRTLAEPSE